MRGVNRVMLIGRLGQDPTVRYTQSGSQVTTLSIATSEKWKDQGGSEQEHTEWHRVVMFRRLAEIAAQYLNKGAAVYVDGKLRTRQWDKDGETRYTTEIIAEEMQMLGSRDSGGGSRRSSTPSREFVQASTAFQAPSGGGGMGDDVPFAPVPNV